MTIVGMTNRAEPRWQSGLRDLARSGLSVREFAERHGLSKWTVHGWKQRQRELERGASDLVAVEVISRESAAPETPTGFEVVLGEGVTIRVPPGFGTDELRRLLEVLGSRPC